MLVPAAGSRLPPKSFMIELKRSGGPAHHRWLVVSWAPHGVSEASMLADAAKNQGPIPKATSLSSRWLLLPLCLMLGTILMLPIFLGVRERVPEPAPSGRTAARLRLLAAYTGRAMARKIRVVIAKPGLDGHDRGAKIIARALRDAGMEVIYTGLHQTPEQIVETAIQEDADAVGISILSGAHMTLVPRILDGLREAGADDVLVIVGGTIPGDDAEALKAQGVAGVFTPGAPTSEIVDFLRATVAA